jgi:DEAD/DEAH box helicase domain-containing protein
MPHAPWSPPRGIDSVVGEWLDSRRVRPCLTADETLAARVARHAPFPDGLGPGLARALRKRGIEELYVHQAHAFEAATRGKSVVVATPTASGKSLCFHLPVLDAMTRDPGARALYLFPTKALARDQEAGLRDLMRDAEVPTSAVVFDGDTPADARRAARERGGVIITNPDMLHAGVLPHHTAWARTFQHLRYIVVDELHTYKGVFGSHVANVLRRLLRVAAFHGSHPVLIGATATIGNPTAHASRLFGVAEEDLVTLGENGAPQGARRFFLFNPPVVNAELGIRASYVKQAVMLANDLVRAEVPTILFGQSRNNVELMLRYLRDRTAGEIDPARIMGYRGGYLPETRREIERKLRSGEVLAVVATNALELGIDIGELDAVICAGYPGSTAAMWQRFGRAGRRGGLSVCVLVTSSAPVDQYLARDPAFLLGAPIEEARIDPDNVEILVQHLKCAAFELPFARGDAFGSLAHEETADALGFLAKHDVLHEANGTFHWAADAYPANHVSLRSVGWDNVVIIDAEHDATLAEIDYRGAHTMVHEQAIYQHDGECWQVERFDHENHKAFVRKVMPDYYTDAMTHVQVAILEETAEGDLTAAGARVAWKSGWGEVSVVEKVVGYKKIKFHTHENAGYGEVRLPEMQMHTTAYWLTLPDARMNACPGGRAAAIDALRGVGKALETVATLALMCDGRDFGVAMGDAQKGVHVEASKDPSSRRPPLDTRSPPPGLPPSSGGGVSVARSGSPRAYDPTLFLYEHVPGGTGLAERVYEQQTTLLASALALIAGCACDGGCPACVGPADVSLVPAGGRVTRRSLAMELLRDAVAARVTRARAGHAATEAGATPA